MIAFERLCCVRLCFCASVLLNLIFSKMFEHICSLPSENQISILPLFQCQCSQISQPSQARPSQHSSSRLIHTSACRMFYPASLVGSIDLPPLVRSTSTCRMFYLASLVGFTSTFRVPVCLCDDTRLNSQKQRNKSVKPQENLNYSCLGSGAWVM